MTASVDTRSVNDDRENYHKADVKRIEFLEKCNDPDFVEKRPSQILLIAVIAFVIVSELALVFYFMGEHLGTTSAFYASSTAIIFVFCSSFGAAFSHANTSRNLPLWRRLLGLCGIAISVGIFLYGLGLLCSWRADSVTLGFQAVIDGYKAMSNLSIFVTALVNVFGFALLTYETRIYCWPPYWGYRQINQRYEDAKNAWRRTQAELKNEG